MANLRHTKGPGRHGYCKGGEKRSGYRSWSGMLQRCYNPRCREYEWYGSRGITVCDRWREAQGFVNFLHDVGPQPAPRASLNRIDNDGDYCPGNVAWSDPKTQNRNRRSNRIITYQDKSQTVVEWAEELGMKPVTLQQRLFKGNMTVEEALTTPVEFRRPYCEWVCRNPNRRRPGRKPSEQTNANPPTSASKKGSKLKPRTAPASARTQSPRRTTGKTSTKQP